MREKEQVLEQIGRLSTGARAYCQNIDQHLLFRCDAQYPKYDVYTLHTNLQRCETGKCKLKFHAMRVFLMAYKATAEVIFDRLINVKFVCQVFKPMLKHQSYKNLSLVIKQFLLCLEVQNIYS